MNCMLAVHTPPSQSLRTVALKGTWCSIEQPHVIRDTLARRTRNLYVATKNHINNRLPIADTTKRWIEPGTHAFRHGAALHATAKAELEARRWQK